MLDTLSGFKATSFNSTSITGYKLAGRMRASTPTELAFVGARLVAGETHLVEPRVAQVARLLRVPAVYVEAAVTILRCDPQLEHVVLDGYTPLLDASVQARPPNPSLITVYMAASPAEREELGRFASPGVIWDEVVIPAL